MKRRLVFWGLLAVMLALYCLGGALWAEAKFREKCEAHIEKLEGYPHATLDYLSTVEIEDFR